MWSTRKEEKKSGRRRKGQLIITKKKTFSKQFVEFWAFKSNEALSRGFQTTRTEEKEEKQEDKRGKRRKDKFFISQKYKQIFLKP